MGKKIKIKKIGILSLAKISALLYAIMGLIVGVFMALISLIGAAFSQSTTGMFGMLFGVGAIILLPIFYGAMGFVMGVVTAWLYNIIANWIGGLELEFE